MKPDPIAYPPRMLARYEAARYCGVGLHLFDDMVKDGRLPPPHMANSRVIWDRVALDVACTSLPQKDVDQRSSLQKMLDGE